MYCSPISFRVLLSYLIPCTALLSHSVYCSPISFRVLLSYLIPCTALLSHSVYCSPISFRVLLSYLIPCTALLSHSVYCSPISFRVLLSYLIPCTVFLSHSVYCSPILPATCKRPALPAYVQVAMSGSGPGSSATYSCSGGRTLVGRRVARCAANGTWSSIPPTCVSSKLPHRDYMPNFKTSPEYSRTQVRNGEKLCFVVTVSFMAIPYVCACACVAFVCVPVCACVWVHVFVCVRAFVRACACTGTHVWVCICLYVHPIAFVCADICILYLYH